MTPWLLVTLIVALDQASKLAVRAWMRPSGSIALLPRILHLTYVQNTGMAFGLFRGYPYVFVALAIGVAAWIVHELRQGPRHGWAMYSLALVLGGAIGNLIDRVRLGYVVDFIDLRVWPVFNLADSAITIGVIILIWRSMFPDKTATESRGQHAS